MKVREIDKGSNWHICNFCKKGMHSSNFYILNNGARMDICIKCLKDIEAQISRINYIYTIE